MNQFTRKVKFTTIFNILKKRPIQLIFGLGFTLMPIVTTIVLSLIFFSMEDTDVDYDLINSQGRELKAEVISARPDYSTTINGLNPTIIYYKYNLNGKEIEAKYKFLDEERLDTISDGTLISIKEFKGNSIIKGLKPFKFPIGTFLLVPVIFLIVGIPFLIYLYYYLNKELKLYKNGILSKARILSMIPNFGIPIINIGRGLIVFYEYELNGSKITGESLTNELSLIGEKKNGDEIPIFVSDENDEISCIVPKSESYRNDWGIEFN